ncbi:DEAD-box ATP-dependent RNA helicase [Haplosporangium sp. Z 27]|nr:DEAD-box ATP-dependent RNA helicase [Haplosporangium sp. Z 27]
MDPEVSKWGDRGEDPFWIRSNDAPVRMAYEKETYEWPEDITDGNAPANPELEQELYDTEFRVHAGANFDKYAGINVSKKGGPESYKPLQSKNAIPIIMAGYDLMACAQTGSGKTAAFLLPVLSKLFTKLERSAEAAPNKPGARRTKASPMALIISPTRELGIQIFEETRRFSYQTRVRPLVIYGGVDVRSQKERLALGCDVLIATPGRLADTMERGAVALDRVKYLILDEADRMLDMGFEPIIRDIILSSDLPRDESLQTMMFSATYPSQIQVMAQDFMKEDFCRLRIGRIGGTTTDIVQKVLNVEEYDKEQTLVELLLSQPPSRTIIFVGTKRKADYLDDVLYNKHFPCISLHGDRSQQERELALEAFKVGRSPILVATAVAARGLDIKDILHVINYDLSDNIDDYVQQIGRTARAGNQGLATTFYNEERNYRIAPQLTKLLVECQQTVPDFLSGYLTEKIPDEEDFVDLDAPDDMVRSSEPPPSNSLLSSHESILANNPKTEIPHIPAPAQQDPWGPKAMDEPFQTPAPSKPDPWDPKPTTVSSQPPAPSKPDPWGPKPTTVSSQSPAPVKSDPWGSSSMEKPQSKEWNAEAEAAARGW